MAKKIITAINIQRLSNKKQKTLKITPKIF